MLPAQGDATARRMGTAALAGVLVFTVVCTAVQFLRADLDWLRTPLSFYLVDAYGRWVQAAYVLLSMSLGLIGIGYHRAMAPGARSGVARALFVLAGIALTITAVAETNRNLASIDFEGYVHAIAAPLAFLFVSTGMLLLSWRLRADGRWRTRFGPAFVLAAVSFAALWGHALWRSAPRGATQKAVILLILAWLGLMALWLRRAEAPAPDRLATPAGMAAGDG